MPNKVGILGNEKVDELVQVKAQFLNIYQFNDPIYILHMSVLA
jgi:hypothetical protein